MQTLPSLGDYQSKRIVQHCWTNNLAYWLTGLIVCGHNVGHIQRVHMIINNVSIKHEGQVMSCN